MNGKGTDGNVRRKPRETTGPLRSQKRIGNDEDLSRIESFVRARSAAAAPATDHERIAERAFAIWQQRGCPSGRDLATWCEAEAQLKSKPAR